MFIRPVRQADYEALMQLYNAFVGEDRYSRYDNDSFLKVLKSPLNFTYVAEHNGQLIGFASFSIRSVIRYPRPIAELDELFVDPTQRQHGLGHQLMERVEQTAREQGCYRLYIESHYRYTAAHKFYEGLGYTNNGYHFLKNL